MDNKEAIAILKEGSKHYCDDIASCEECDRVICAAKIDEAIKVVEEDARPKGEWIPVSERLPEEYGNYLVFTSDNDIDVGTFSPQFENSWSMCDADGFYWVMQKGIEITHWRPLTKAPESEDKK